MPYRQLPEQARARDQVDLKTQRRLRALERRSRYPGMRRIREAAFVDVTTGSDGVYLTMNVDQGSWLVNAGLNVLYSVNNAIERASVYVYAYDQADGGLLDPIGPPAHWAATCTPSSGHAAVRQPFSLFGHGHFAAPARLELRVVLSTADADGSAATPHAVRLQDLCLQASPM